MDIKFYIKKLETIYWKIKFLNNLTPQENFDVAILKNNIKKVKSLLSCPDVNPSIDDSDCLRTASKEGYIEIVTLLLNDKRADPTSLNHYSVVFSAINGHLDILTLLLSDSRVNPSNYQNMPIIESYNFKQYESINILWQNNKVKDSLKNDNLFLYNKLIKSDIKNKINNFN
jgi:hypothetical protein